MPTDSYVLMFSPELPSESIASVQAVICAAIYADIPSPDHWYRDVVYTAHQLGLKDGAVTPGFTSLLSRTLTPRAMRGQGQGKPPGNWKNGSPWNPCPI